MGVQQVVQLLLSRLQSGSGDAQDPSAPSTEEIETVNASSAAASSKGPWQSAAENNPVHAVVLQHMCQLHPTHSTLMTSAAACDPAQTSRQPLHSASEVTLHEGSGQQRSQARAHMPAASNREGNSTQLHKSSAVTSIHAEAASISSSSDANTSFPSPVTHRTAAPTELSSATQPHPSSSFPEPAVSHDVALQTSVTNSSPQGTSGVRQAAHKRLATPNRQKLKQAASWQHEAAAFRAVLQAAPAVLQDMAVNIAEAASACYLAEARSGLQGKLLA